ncbi:MAG: ABC transporter substrate-binding protein, partial [Ruminococcus sp.]|nr:ABC transporter substrate-binding protein [Ruminococcus sp.]
MSRRKFKKGFLSVTLAGVMGLSLLSACSEKSPVENTGDVRGGDVAGEGASAAESSALTWMRWGGYDDFWALLAEKYPDIEVEQVGYGGANYTGYSWTQMGADDITDLFSTSQILDRELTKERLLDLSGYDFLSEISTSVLDQVSIDGGVYLLPVSNSMFGIYYNKTLMEEMGWEVPQNFAELESLCEEIKAAGLTPGYLGTQLTGNAFSAVFNLAKTDWLTTAEGTAWEKDFLAGDAAAAGKWEKTVDYMQKYIDMGMFSVDPDDRANAELIEDYLEGRKTVFFTVSAVLTETTLKNGDELGMMPYIGEDGS